MLRGPSPGSNNGIAGSAGGEERAPRAVGLYSLSRHWVQSVLLAWDEDTSVPKHLSSTHRTDT